MADRGDKVGYFMEAAPLHPMIAALATSGFGATHRSSMETLAVPASTPALAAPSPEPPPAETADRLVGVVHAAIADHEMLPPFGQPLGKHCRYREANGRRDR